MFMTLRVIALALLLAATFVFVTKLKFERISAAQNANSSSTQNANSSRPTNRPAQPDFSKNTWELPANAEKTPNSVPASAESIAKGEELYMERTKGNCVFCHGDTGAGNQANLPKLRRKPADLTKKERMAAMTDGEVFWKISKGINGIMPAGEKRMSEEERWNVVNYVRTLSTEKE